MYDRDVRPFGYSFVGFHFLPEILDRLILVRDGLIEQLIQNSTSGSRPQSTAHLVIRIVRSFQCRSIIPRHVQSFLDLLIKRHLQSHPRRHIPLQLA